LNTGSHKSGATAIDPHPDQEYDKLAVIVMSHPTRDDVSHEVLH
jgi:hypothetical protein